MGKLIVKCMIITNQKAFQNSRSSHCIECSLLFCTGFFFKKTAKSAFERISQFNIELLNKRGMFIFYEFDQKLEYNLLTSVGSGGQILR